MAALGGAQIRPMHVAGDLDRVSPRLGRTVAAPKQRPQRLPNAGRCFHPQHHVHLFPLKQLSLIFMSPNHICSHLETAQGPSPPAAVSASGWKVPSTCRHPGSQPAKGSMGSSRGPQCWLVLGGAIQPSWALGITPPVTTPRQHTNFREDSNRSGDKPLHWVLADLRFALGGFSHTCQKPALTVQAPWSDFFSFLLSPCSAQPQCWGDTDWGLGGWAGDEARTATSGAQHSAVESAGDNCCT